MRLRGGGDEVGISNEIQDEFDLLSSNDIEDAKSIGVVYQTLQGRSDETNRGFKITRKISHGTAFNVRKEHELKVFSKLILSDNCIIQSCIDVGVTIETGLRWIRKLDEACEKRGTPFFIDWGKHAPFGYTDYVIKSRPIIRKSILEIHHVKTIKRSINDGYLSYSVLSKLFGVSPSTISSIDSGMTHKEVRPITMRQLEYCKRRIRLMTASELDFKLVEESQRFYHGND